MLAFKKFNFSYQLNLKVAALIQIYLPFLSNIEFSHAVEIGTFHNNAHERGTVSGKKKVDARQLQFVRNALIGEAVIHEARFNSHFSSSKHKHHVHPSASLHPHQLRPTASRRDDSSKEIAKPVESNSATALRTSKDSDKVLSAAAEAAVDYAENLSSELLISTESQRSNKPQLKLSEVSSDRGALSADRFLAGGNNPEGIDLAHVRDLPDSKMAGKGDRAVPRRASLEKMRDLSDHEPLHPVSKKERNSKNAFAQTAARYGRKRHMPPVSRQRRVKRRNKRLSKNNNHAAHPPQSQTRVINLSRVSTVSSSADHQSQQSRSALSNQRESFVDARKSSAEAVKKNVVVGGGVVVAEEENGAKKEDISVLNNGFEEDSSETNWKFGDLAVASKSCPLFKSTASFHSGLVSLSNSTRDHGFSLFLEFGQSGVPGSVEIDTQQLDGEKTALLKNNIYDPFASSKSFAEDDGDSKIALLSCDRKPTGLSMQITATIPKLSFQIFSKNELLATGRERRLANGTAVELFLSDVSGNLIARTSGDILQNSNPTIEVVFLSDEGDCHVEDHTSVLLEPANRWVSVMALSHVTAIGRLRASQRTSSSSLSDNNAIFNAVMEQTWTGLRLAQGPLLGIGGLYVCAVLWKNIRVLGERWSGKLEEEFSLSQGLVAGQGQGKFFGSF